MLKKHWFSQSCLLDTHSSHCQPHRYPLDTPHFLTHHWDALPAASSGLQSPILSAQARAATTLPLHPPGAGLNQWLAGVSG